MTVTRSDTKGNSYDDDPARTRQCRTRDVERATIRSTAHCSSPEHRWTRATTARERTALAAECHQCPLWRHCSITTVATINDGERVVDVVQAGIAWDSNGLPDVAVHGPPSARLAYSFGLGTSWEIAQRGETVFTHDPDHVHIRRVMNGSLDSATLTDADRHAVTEQM